MKRFLLALALILSAASIVVAQDTLRSVTFGQSPDQTATMADGTPILARYELTIDRLANPAAVPPILGAVGVAVLNLGKPTPVGGTISLLNVAVPVTLTGGDYLGRLAAVGPGGRSGDLSAPFSQPTVPRAVAAPAAIVR